MGLFGPSKGVVILLTQEQIEEMIETKHPSYRQSHEDIRVWAPVSAEVSYSSRYVLVKTKKFKYEFPADKLKKVVVFDNAKEAYYFAGDLIKSKEKSPKEKESEEEPKNENEISIEEFERFCHENNVWPMTVGDFKVAVYPSNGMQLQNMNVYNGRADVSVNGITFNNLDTSVVAGVLINGDKGYLVVKNKAKKNSAKKETKPVKSKSEADEDPFNKSQDFDLTQVSKVVVDSDVASINFVQSNRCDQGIGNVTSEGKLTGYTDYQYSAEVRNGVLYVKERVTGNNIRGNLTITIALLNYTINEIKVNSTNGNVGYYVGGSAFLNGAITTTNGNIDIDFGTSGISGFDNSFEMVKVKSTNGNIHFKMELMNTSNVYIAYAGIDIQTTNGNINGEIMIANNVSVKSTNGDVYMNGYFNNVDAQTTNGDIEVQQSYYSDGTATITSNSGDITYTPYNVNAMNLSTSSEVNSKGYTKNPNGYTANVSLTSRNGDITIKKG